MAAQAVLSEITGKVWKVLCPVGTEVGEEEPILIIESMKMEIPVLSPCAGRVTALTVGEGDDVSEGQQVATVEG
jgi:acetyl-CoA carboxylase biotin carboxyl carrier protein